MAKSIFLKRLSTTVQFILGFILGITLIAGVSAGLGFLYYKQMSTLPKKPEFSQDTSSPETAVETAKTSETATDSNVTENEAEATEETEEVEETVLEPEAELPPNAYTAVVTWPQGLSLRAEPNLNAGRVGGISYDAKIIILEDSADGQWQKIRVPWSDQEGWVKAGNTERTSY
jgi:ABC-type Na+ efflux pump permease subunit